MVSRDVQDAEEAAEGADQQPDGGEEDRGLQLEPYLSAKLLSSPLLTHSCKESQPTPPRYERPRRHFCMASVSSTVERCYGGAVCVFSQVYASCHQDGLSEDPAFACFVLQSRMETM